MNFEINIKNILKFTLPCIITMVFTSIFVMSDGIIVSNFINETALAAINLVFPVTSLFLAIGLMFGSGTSAIASKMLGEGKIQKAKETVSAVLVVALVLGGICSILIQFNIDNILSFLGTSEETYDYAYKYLRILSCFSSILMIQTIFQSVMVVSGKAVTYFKAMMTSGVIKISLSYLFVAVLGLETVGLAISAAIGYSIPVLISFITLFKKNPEGISLVKPVFDKKVILNTCTNGSSEMVTNLATAVTTFLFNSAMIKLVGDSGVSAVTVILYIQFLLSSIFLGYSIGIAPLIGFSYGRKSAENLKKIFRSSLKMLVIISVVSSIIGIVFSNNLASLFSEAGTDIYNLASNGLRIFSIAFLFIGINIFASGLFTAYSNGKISALISVIRTLVLISSLLIVLPNFLGVNGVWIAVPIAEFLTIFVSAIFFNKYKEKYMYGSNVEITHQIENKEKEEKLKSENVIITINRMFGSGGREVGKRIAEELNISYYDEDIINDVLNEEGLTDEYLEKYSDINFSKKYEFNFATTFTKYKENTSADIFEKKADAVEKLSEKGDGIFVGVCANYVLRNKNPFRIFIYASDEKYIIDRLYEKDKDKNKEVKTDEELKKLVHDINDNRKKYYKYYTGDDLENSTNYDIVIDISKIGIKRSVEMIKCAISAENQVVEI